MQEQLDTLKKVRTFLLETIKDLSAEQLNKIPEGFNNNIIWNMGHMVAAQYGVCYARSGAQVPDEAIVNTYKSGTKPEGVVGEQEIAKIKSLLLSSLERINEDFQQDTFVNYTEWTTRYGKTISSAAEAISFLPYHDGLHMGCISALRKLV